MKKQRNSQKTKGVCPECGSSIVIDDGVLKCSQSALEDYANEFQQWQTLTGTELDKKVQSLSFKMYDMYHRWVYVNPYGERTQFCCTYNPNLEFSPMTKAEMILPDPAQQMIAETILKRPLTPEEYYGEEQVPLLSDYGSLYTGQIEQMVFPRDFKPKYKDMIDKTDYTPTPVIFNWDDL
jgi:hypothetical protein